MMKILVEELKEMYAVLDDAIQNSDHTDFDQCYWALEELCKNALLGSRIYEGVAFGSGIWAMVDKGMKYVQGLMSKEEEKAYLDDEWKRLTGKEEGKE